MKLFLTLFAACIISTMTMDIGAGMLRAAKVTAGVPAGLTGKWIESSLKGTIFVNDIRTCAGEPAPLKSFLLYHYLIGILLTLFLYSIIALLKINPVPWWVPMCFGFATTFLPLLLMYPAMGFGFFGLNGPAEYLLIRTAVLNHLAFGFGLILSFRLVPKIN